MTFWNLEVNKSYSIFRMDFWDIVSIVIALATFVITCYEFYQISRKNAYDRKIKDVEAINKPLCRLIKKNQYLDEMCEKCLEAGGWHEFAARIINFMNTSSYEDFLCDLKSLLYEELLNVLVFSRKTRSEIRRLITHIEELDGLIVIFADPETFKPQEIRKQICNIKKKWLILTKLIARDLMLNTKEANDFCEANIDRLNSMEV